MKTRRLGKSGPEIPLAGARKRPQLADFLTASELALTGADIARIEAAMPASSVLGDRYPENQMGALDSERRRA